MGFSIFFSPRNLMGFSKRTCRNIIKDGTVSSSFSHGKKRARKAVCKRKTTIDALPRDLLVDVLSKVSSSSFTDLFNAKLCSKDFCMAGEDEYIYKCVSMDRFPVVHWYPPSDGMLSFLTNCFEKENPEALFRQGMKEYFSLVKVECGFNYLKKACEYRHIEATYVYSMLLISQGDQSSTKALNLLKSMKSSRNWEGICKCREKIRSVLGAMWINNSVSQQGVNFKCQRADNEIICTRPMGFGADQELWGCDTCMWHHEFINFCKIVRG